MRYGILRECVHSVTAGMGQLAIEDIETGKVELVMYELGSTFKALHRYKGKEVYWDLDEFGMLTKLQPVKDSEILNSL